MYRLQDCFSRARTYPFDYVSTPVRGIALY